LAPGWRGRPRSRFCVTCDAADVSQPNALLGSVDDAMVGRAWPLVLEEVMKPSILLGCLTLGTAALGGCTHTVDCSGAVYRSDCLPGTEIPAIASPATATPAAAGAAAATPATAGPATKSPAAGSSTSWYGDPSLFADVDDRQCRSYGLKFGTHDYADCRIQLSAQHRGLDPNLSPGTTGSGHR
jgi:hypothetical protein